MLSRLLWAVPVNSTGLPSGRATACRRSQLNLGAVGEQRCRALDGEKGAAARHAGRR